MFVIGQLYRGNFTRLAFGRTMTNRVETAIINRPFVFLFSDCGKTTDCPIVVMQRFCHMADRDAAVTTS